jgi:hypothetical protein
LVALTKLDISSADNMHVLPESIGKLPHLKTIILSMVPLTKVPVSFGSLPVEKLEVPRIYQLFSFTVYLFILLIGHSYLLFIFTLFAQFLIPRWTTLTAPSCRLASVHCHA